MTVKLTIPLKLPSQNDVPKHIHAYQRLRNDWYRAAYEAIHSQLHKDVRSHFAKRLGSESAKYRIAITAYLHRQYDQDNLFVKFAVDSLKGVSVPNKEGKGSFLLHLPQLITDDSPKYILSNEKAQVKIPKTALNKKGKKVKVYPYTVLELELIEEQGVLL